MPKFYGISLQLKNGVFKIGYEPHSVGQPIKPNIVVSEIEEEQPIQPTQPIEPSTPKEPKDSRDYIRYYTPLNCDHGFAYKTEHRKHLRKYGKATLCANLSRLYYELRGDWPLEPELTTIMAHLRYFEIDSSKWLSASHIDDTKKVIANYTYIGRKRYSKYSSIAKKLGISRNCWASITRRENIDPELMPSDEVMLRNRALHPYLSKITQPA